MLASEAGELFDYTGGYGGGGGRSPQLYFAERPSRSSDWKLRAGKRASEWQFRYQVYLAIYFAHTWLQCIHRYRELMTYVHEYVPCTSVNYFTVRPAYMVHVHKCAVIRSFRIYGLRLVG